MAINFIKKTKTQQYLIFIFFSLLLIIFIFLLRGQFLKIQPSQEVVIQLPKEIKINFESFGNPTLINFQPFEEITPLLFEGEEVGLNPTLSWQSVADAEIYLWEVVGVESDKTKETSVTVSKKLEPSATYVWRVKACKEDMSQCGSWSSNCQVGYEIECWRFKTIQRPSVTLSAPFPGAENVSFNPTLSWQSVADDEICLWEVVGVESGKTVDSGETKETSVTVSKKLEPFTAYVWRVMACKEDMSQCGLWSSQTFTTSLALLSPELVAPEMKEIFIKGREDPFSPYLIIKPKD